VPSYRGCPGKEAIKWVSVCLFIVENDSLGSFSTITLKLMYYVAYHVMTV